MNLLPPGLSTCLLVLTGAVGAIGTATAADDLTRARSAYAEWARLKSQISAERTEWRREQTLLTDTLAAARAESAALDERIAELAASSTESDRRRSGLQDEITDAKATAQALSARLAAAEAGVRSLLPLLPAPLQAELQPRLQSLPDEAAAGAMALGQRVLLVAGILGHVEKFAANYNLLSEIRDLGGGRSVEVKTLYLGLAVAYFADAAGTTAGYGSPGPSGWEWTTVEGELAQRIGLAIAIHENTRPPAFVTLPVVIR
jgi:hypothetical protein